MLKSKFVIRRIDSEVDQRLLDSFVNALFTPQAYETGFALVPPTTHEGLPLYAPEGTQIQDYLDWCHKLPEREVSLHRLL